MHPGQTVFDRPGQLRRIGFRIVSKSWPGGRRPSTSRTSTGTTCGLPALCRRHMWAHLHWRSRTEHRDDVRASAVPVGVLVYVQGSPTGCFAISRPLGGSALDSVLGSQALRRQAHG